jgi:16S rRNA processing protein RimM
MMETGANDVMVLQGDRERLIPFVIDEIVREVDLANKRVVVDWQPDY